MWFVKFFDRFDVKQNYVFSDGSYYHRHCFDICNCSYDYGYLRLWSWLSLFHNFIYFSFLFSYIV